MPDINARTNAERGRLFYDDTCRFCRGSIARLRPILNRHGILTVPFANGAAEPEMQLRWHDGREFGGADAAIFLTGRIWWAWPLRALVVLPGIRPLAHVIYRQIASRRHCLNGTCELPLNKTRVRPSLTMVWTTAVLLVAAVYVTVRTFFPDTTPLSLMWLLAFAQWTAFKVIAWSRPATPPNWQFFAWVGMDAKAFTERRDAPHPNPVRVWQPIGFLFIGLFLLGVAAPTFGDRGHRAIAGALTITGLVAGLHFGLFALMAKGWHRLGYPVTPIMRAPWRTAGLAEFWGTRWNRAFSDVARVAVFRPLVRRLGTATGTLAGFLVSGAAHELVISVPARAGWGLPTLYFAIQGLGVLLERRLFAKDRHPILSRCFTWFLILAPAPILFHRPFLETVINLH